MWYFQRNCFIFKVKLLEEARLSEKSLILLEIQSVWDNAGQKYSLMSGAQYLASFFFAVQNWWISCIRYPGNIYFTSMIIIKLWLYNNYNLYNVILLNSFWKFSSLIQRLIDFVCMACFAWLHFLYITESTKLNPEFT